MAGMAGLNDPHLIPADAIVHNSCRGPGFAHTPMKISLRYRDENFSPLPGAGQLRGHALAEGFGAERPAEIGGAGSEITLSTAWSMAAAAGSNGWGPLRSPSQASSMPAEPISEAGLAR